MSFREETLIRKVREVFSKLPKLQVEVNDVKIGITFCRCYLKVGPNVKESHIRGYAEYLARELRLKVLPIIKTIYEDGSIVIDIPNEKRKVIHLDSCLKSSNFKQVLSLEPGLPYIVGIDNDGDIVCGDLTSAPHMLIAGQSGSGKSVVMRCILNSLIGAWANYPMRCQLVLLDPKGVELIHYRELRQVISYSSNPEEIVNILEVLVKKMERRYEEFMFHASALKEEITDINSYNKYYCGLKNLKRTFAYIVVFIDELADILLRFKECEESILRLVQKARACGIHLVMATQRPSNDIISGPIRANIPTKICCKVCRPIDARIVFGDSDHGAHQLLGKGDMLYIDEHYSEPIRLQGAFTDLEFIRSYKEYVRSKRGKVLEFSSSLRRFGPSKESATIPFDVHSYSRERALYAIS